MAAQYKRGQIFRKFHLQKQFQAQAEVDDLKDASSKAEVVEDVPEMRSESPESEDERVEVPVVNPTNKPAVSGKRNAPQTKSSCRKKAKMFSWPWPDGRKIRISFEG